MFFIKNTLSSFMGSVLLNLFNLLHLSGRISYIINTFIKINIVKYKQQNKTMFIFRLRCTGIKCKGSYERDELMKANILLLHLDSADKPTGDLKACNTT